EFIMQAGRVTIFVDPASNSVQHEFDRWVVRLMDLIRHGALHREICVLSLSHAGEIRVVLDQNRFGRFRYACWLSGSFSPAWDGPQPNGAPQHRYDWGRLPSMMRVNARCRQKRTLMPPL